MKKLIVLFSLIFIVNFAKAQCSTTYDSTWVPLCQEDLFVYHGDTLHHVYDSMFVFKGDTALNKGVFYDTLINYLGCDSIYKIEIELMEPYTYEFYQNSTCQADYIYKYVSAGNGFLCHSRKVSIQYYSIKPMPVLFIMNDTIFLNDTANYNVNYFPTIDSHLSLLDCDSSREYCWFFPLNFNSPVDTIKIPINFLFPNYCNKLHSGNYKFGIKNSTSNYYPSWVSTLYDVECTNYSNCVFIDFSNISGIYKSPKNNYKLNFFPNPTANELKISSPENLKISKIEIENIVGQVVFTQLINNATTQSINVSSLAQGMYLLKCTDENGMVHQTKFVKQ